MNNSIERRTSTLAYSYRKENPSLLADDRGFADAKYLTQSCKTIEQDLLFLRDILGSNNTRKKALLLASNLISVFGSLVGVLAADITDIAAARDVGIKNAAIIKAAHAMILGVFSAALPAKSVVGHAALVNMIILTIGESIVEQVLVIYLNKRGCFIGQEILCSGSESSVSTSPKVIVSAACRRGAAALVIAHNHPGGSVEPSDEDLILTRKIVCAASALDIKIADHVIVSGRGYFSFRKERLI